MRVGAAVVNYVGGKIFYIDSTATGTYTFKNALGNTVAAPSVGDDCTGWTYTLSGGNGKDKYYVADLTNRTYLNRKYDNTNYIIWATSCGDEWNSYIGVTTFDDTTVGNGKPNTAWIKTNEGSSVSYYPKTVGGVSNRISIWDIAEEANANAANGCTDWYCPSLGEMRALRTTSETADWYEAVKAPVSNTMRITWTSSINSHYVYVWIVDGGPYLLDQGESTDYGYPGTTNDKYNCVLIRSF